MVVLYVCGLLFQLLVLIQLQLGCADKKKSGASVPSAAKETNSDQKRKKKSKSPSSEKKDRSSEEQPTTPVESSSEATTPRKKSTTTADFKFDALPNAGDSDVEQKTDLQSDGAGDVNPLQDKRVQEKLLQARRKGTKRNGEATRPMLPVAEQTAVSTTPASNNPLPKEDILRNMTTNSKGIVGKPAAAPGVGKSKESEEPPARNNSVYAII